MKNVKKIVFTGGHAATTALATIEELIKKDNRGRWKIYWIGASTAIEGKKIRPIEHYVFPNLGVILHKVRMGRLQRKWSLQTLPSLAKIPLGFLEVLILVLKIRPHIIVSFGGYVALPVVIIGFFWGIPIIIHEQTTAVGLANKLSSIFATKIALARRQSRPFFPKNKTVLIGNPLMKGFSSVYPKKKLGDPAVLFITSGSRGARRINKIIDQVLEELVNNFKVIHITGETDFEYFCQRKRALDSKLQRKYWPHEFIDPREISTVYKRSDIIVARGGANTVSEIMATARPSVIIPIPWTRYNEQFKNGLLAQKTGIALVLEEKDLASKTLLAKIFLLENNWQRMISTMDREIARLDLGAARRLINLIEKVSK